MFFRKIANGVQPNRRGFGKRIAINSRTEGEKCRVANRAVNPNPAKQRIIRRIDSRIDILPGNLTLHKFERGVVDTRL